MSLITNIKLILPKKIQESRKKVIPSGAFYCRLLGPGRKGAGRMSTWSNKTMRGIWVLASALWEVTKNRPVFSSLSASVFSFKKTLHRCYLLWRIILYTLPTPRLKVNFPSSSLSQRRRRWQPTPVFLLGESQGWGSLVGCHLWGHTESDMTEVMQQQQQHRHEEFFFTYGGSIILFSDRADSILRVDDEGVLHPEIIYQLSHLLLRHAFSPLRASTDFS